MFAWAKPRSFRTLKELIRLSQSSTFVMAAVSSAVKGAISLRNSAMETKSEAFCGVKLASQRMFPSNDIVLAQSSFSGIKIQTTSENGNVIRTRASMSARSEAKVLTQDELKQIAAEKAVEYVKSGMVLGLGTGSTAAFAVAKIGELLKEGKLKDIVGVPTSKRTAEQAESLGIPLSILDDHPKIDLAIDGADEVDPDLNLVKGRGGALLREKMVEMASAQFVVIVDETKLVDGLGGSGLAMPVEVVQFCWKYNLERLQTLPEVAGCEAKLRMDGDKPYVTDNSNYIIDLYFETPIKDAKAAGDAISKLEGVVDHGLFLDMASVVIIAGSDGISVKTK